MSKLLDSEFVVRYSLFLNSTVGLVNVPANKKECFQMKGLEAGAVNRPTVFSVPTA